MTKTVLALSCLLVFAGCATSQMASFTSKTAETQWKITASKSSISSMISIAINDSVVVEEKPAPFSNTIEAKGVYQGHEVHFYSVYNSGILGLFGTGWETTVLVDKELAARFKL
jgi:hypothetical protein